MKKTAQTVSTDNSYSVGEAASVLGLSIPTVKRMAQAGTLETFRTPGGHLRVSVESVEAIKDQRRSQSRSVQTPSPVLQNRREHLEELTIQAQEHRARRELEKLQREDQEEAERRGAEAQARGEEAEQRQAEIELERERLEQQEAQERERQERERAEERRRREVECELAAFRCRWQQQGAEAASAWEYRWLSATQRKEVLERLEAEIDRRRPADEPLMRAIIARSLEAIVEPVRAERDAQERRQKATNEALWSLPYSATDAEKVTATAAIREALRRFDGSVDVCNEMRVAAQEAIRPIRQAIERRQLDARLITWALRELPPGRTDRDEARIRRECAEILAELPADLTDAEAKEALVPTVQEACAEISKKQAEKDRQARKAGLIEAGLAEASSYLLKLRNEGEISDEEYWDSDFTTDLREAVRRTLDAKLTGGEAANAVRQQAQRIVNDQLD